MFAGHLEKLKADVGAASPVCSLPAVTTGYPQAEVTLSSMQMVESLIRLGVTPRKSLTVKPWSGPDHLMRHYWRGMVDGDGSIVRHPGQREKWHIVLVGSKPCTEAFADWASSKCGSVAKVTPKVNIWSWTVGGLAAPQLLARELYGGSMVYLDRKYQLAQRLMALPVLHRSKTTGWREAAAA